MNVFYTQNIQGSSGILDETESHHCIRVLRLQAGHTVCLVDGKGGFFEGTITIANHKACIVEIEKAQYNFGKRNYRVHIAIAPTKNIDRFEWFLEKATEIGIDEITPIICERSERRVLREDRLEKVISTAMKQSLKAYLPVLNPVTPFNNFIGLNHAGNKLIAHCLNVERHDLIKLSPSGEKFTLLVGPEGDFTEKEVQMATAEGFLPTSLGLSRLRTETAGVVACQIISDLMAIQ